MNALLNRMIEPARPIPAERQKFNNSAIIHMALPVIGEQFLVFLVGIADAFMISYAGEAAVSGVSLVNQLNTLFLLVFASLSAGGSVVISQYLGSRDRDAGERATGQLMLLSILVGGLSLFLVVFGGDALFSVLFGKVDTSVSQAGRIYLRISAYSYLALAAYNGCAGLFRSLGDMQTIFKVSIAMNGINVVGNAIGIFVLHAGVKGVAYPSLIARTLAAAALVVLACRKKQELGLRLTHLARWDGDMIARIVRVSLPGGIENGVYQLTKVGITAIIALFGTTQIAAYGIATNFWNISSLLTLSTGTVFITIVGQYIGAGDREGAVYYNEKLIRMLYTASIGWNGMMILLTPLLLQVFQISAEGKRLVLIMVIFYNVLNAIAEPMEYTMTFGLRAAGDVKYSMYASLFTTVVLRTICTWIFAVVLQMGVLGVALAMHTDWCVKGILILRRWRSGKWLEYTVI